VRHIAVSLTCLWVFAVLQPAHAAAADAPPPVATFFANPALGGARLSPSGKYLAVRSGAPNSRDSLAVIDVATGAGTRVAYFSDADIGAFEWVNDERLVFGTADRQLGAGNIDFAPGLFAVNRDGSKLRQLADRTGNGELVRTGTRTVGRDLLPWSTFMLRQAGAQDSAELYVIGAKFDGGGDFSHYVLIRVNTLTGETHSVPSPGAVQQWVLDQNGAPRLAVVRKGPRLALDYLDPASGEWRELAAYAEYSESERAPFSPLGFGPDGTLYVIARRGSDKAALHTFDFGANAVSAKPLVALDDYDFEGTLVMDRARLLGVHVVTDIEEGVWLDPGMKALQKAVDAALPGTMNLVSVPRRAETPWVLVESRSDVLPATYVLFNRETGKLSKVGESYPAIRAAEMAHQQVVRYKARDGLGIPALLTLPKGSSGKNLPLVVLVHGGPFVRGGTWGWNPESQFLASRGYAVLEPEFRGSTGFGWAHFRAGWKQWGLRMQDDVADGARWMIAQGMADPKRICIAGASYGGYATLMGLVNDPDLYKCGVEWAGVTDIKLLYSGHWSFQSDMSDRWKDYGMPLLVGDPVQDAAQLKATSPLEQAARIRQPLLLAYGGWDRRVPLYHGEHFRDAVRRNNPAVEWIVYPEEGHGWALPKNRVDFWSRVEKFLDKQIGKGAIKN
jgi:dipeptidyl aminopeptidase/acylaminoacyl peptidase